MERKTLKSLSRTFVLLAVVLTLAGAAGSAAAAKKPLSYDAYNGWRSIQGTQLSRDGQWLVYALAPQDGDGELIVRDLKTDREFRAARGRQPVITVDGKFVVFSVAPLKAEVDKAKKDKKKPEEQPKSALGIMDLATGQVTTVDRVKSFKVPEEFGSSVAYLLEPPLKKPDEKKEEPKKEPEAKPEAKKEEGKTEEPKKEEKKKEPGTELVVRELATGKETRIAEAVEYIWSKPGTRLAYTVSSKVARERRHLLVRSRDGQDRSPSQGARQLQESRLRREGPAARVHERPRRLQVRKVGLQALSLAGHDRGRRRARAGRGQGLSGGHGRQRERPAPVLQGRRAALLRHRRDTQARAQGCARARQGRHLELEGPLSPAHAEGPGRRGQKEDPDVRHAPRTEGEEVRSAGHLRGSPTSRFPRTPRSALGSSDLAYRPLVSWDQSYEDIYVVNVNDGSKRKILEKTPGGARLSPGGAWVYYFNDPDNAWYSYRIADGKTFNLTGKLGVRFDDEDGTPRTSRGLMGRRAGPTATRPCSSTTATISGRSRPTARRAGW